MKQQADLKAADVDVAGALGTQRQRRANGVSGTAELAPFAGDINGPGPGHNPAVGGLVTPAFDTPYGLQQSRRQIEGLFGVERGLLAGAGGPSQQAHRPGEYRQSQTLDMIVHVCPTKDDALS